MGSLYIVPTPIGNLEDITLRALRILRDVSLIAAEDTRTTGKLLSHFEIKNQLISYHEHNKLTRLDTIIEALSGGDVALVSDAGTPGLSDPGYELIKEALNFDYAVIPLPGASAMLPALVASGLPTDRFTFAGFLPRKAKARRETLLGLKNYEHTLIFYESPHRVIETLETILDVFGDSQVVLGREISKMFEEFIRGSVSELLNYFTTTEPRGEFVLLIDGKPTEPEIIWDEDQIRGALLERLNAGDSINAASKKIAAQSGLKKREIYDIALTLD